MNGWAGPVEGLDVNRQDGSILYKWTDTYD